MDTPAPSYEQQHAAWLAREENGVIPFTEDDERFVTAMAAWLAAHPDDDEDGQR